jgi:hypothetical protein
MSLKVEFRKGLPYNITFLGQNVGTLWGIETSDRHSFFTLTEKGNNFNIISDIISKLSPSSYSRTIEVKMGEGHWNININTYVHENKIVIKTKLLALEESNFQDFVHRYRFSQHSFDYGLIDNKKILFNNSNIWNQYKVNSVELVNNSFKVTINTVSYTTKGYFTPEMYIRDEPGGQWIVHSRFIPRDPKIFWIKWDTRIGRILNIKGAIAKLLLKTKFLKYIFWYRAEKTGGRPNIMGLGLAKIKKDDVIKLHTECVFNSFKAINKGINT